ncbi:NTF2-like N-terminal transpeptidase domain-containing protein [Gordonia shandongensis]|uniref:NTF2-like N-terminal transpeptidase domain-containing protein n=1 Tax=Gordonia shandongensis TaxID=376351 RepID=UPI00040A38EE|nr:NTF2-like N-terminal transpeptidase domain-containing protein [Gordonia shandongensis]
MAFRGGRSAVALIAATAMTLGVASCSSEQETDAARAVNEFADAMARQDTQGAAEMTTSPSQAAETLGATFASMHAREVSSDAGKLVEYSDGSASFTLSTTWRWSDDRSFETTTSGSARRLSSGWKVQWDPGLLMAGMTADSRLQEVRTDATPAPTVRSANKKPFMQMEPVNEIVFNPKATRNVDKSVTALARAIKPIAPLVTAKTIGKKMAESPGDEIVAVTLRDPDMKVLASDPARIAGVTVNKTGKLVMSDRRLSTPLATGITNYWNAIRDATAGWQVQLVVPGSPPRKLAGHQGGPGPDVMTTISQSQQLTLGDAVVEVAQPATMMTLDPKTGGILAMAQNDAAAKRSIDAVGAHPVGDTLDPLYDAIDGVTRGDEKASRGALRSLGLGVDFVTAGVSLPKRVGKPNVSAASYRPENPTASILNMAALGVALDRSASGTDRAAPPYVIKGAETKVRGGGDLGTIDDDVVRRVRAEMARTAAKGDASDLTKAPGLRALVGTDGPQGPGWFIGSQGGRVIVIYCEGEKSGTAALQVAQKYFTIK